MSLAPSVTALLEMFATLPALDVETASAAELRALYDNPGPPDPAFANVEARDLTIALAGRDRPARLYRPPGVANPALVVHYHGGGWVVCTLDTHDDACRRLCAASGAAVLAVSYRLAPEHRYPAAATDCYEALVWAHANAASLGVDATRLAVAGDSAGGNLAASVAIQARDKGGPSLKHQALIYPVTDAAMATPSYAAFGGGEFLLSKAAMGRFWRDYLGATPAAAAPLADILATPNLAGLPPASVLTAAYDPLRDEGRAYATRLRQAGVAVIEAEALDLIHGFWSMAAAMPEGQHWHAWAGRNLAAALA
jgi:acetyl esterase